jgi:hypothetical protein
LKVTAERNGFIIRSSHEYLHASMRDRDACSSPCLSAAAWYRFEPLYYRLYYKLKHEVFY